MRKRTLKGALRYAVVAGAAAAALLLASGSAWASPPTYYPSGPQSNVDQSTLVGWTQCWTSTYASNEPLADILAACPGDYLLLAAGPVSSGVFDVIAAAPRADVIFDTGGYDLYTVHDANGSGWYFNSSWSWGFAQQGAAVYKWSCDITDTGWVDPVNLVTGAYRLCWHTGGDYINGGWRSGNNIFLNGSSDFRRAVYVPVPNQPPTASAGGPYSGNEGSAVAIAGTASDPNAGDTVTTDWSYAPVTADSGATCSFGNAALLSTTVTCTDNGTFTLTLTAKDGFNPVVTSDATLTVSNVNPVASITAPAAGSLSAIGVAVPLTAPFTDAGKHDTHTCTVNWDDGLGAIAGTVAETAGSGSGTCSSSKTFSTAGVYSITVTVTDDNTGAGTATVMVIVYDPNSGFVTGGGSINSAVGAYAADTALTGKANFGFVSKYKKGALTPTGETEFQFQAGSFNFHSDAYQWLVVSGCKAQYKGTGSVNGVTGFGFLLTATDGDICSSKTADKFRIKVWKLSDSSTAYDNKMGASTDIDAADPQEISAGQIVIHK